MTDKAHKPPRDIRSRVGESVQSTRSRASSTVSSARHRASETVATARLAQEHASRAATPMRRALEWIEAHPQLGVVYLTIHRFGAQHLPTYAAAISFQLVISLFPLIGFITAIAAFVVAPEVVVQRALELSEGLAPGAENLLRDALESMAAVRGGVGIVSLVGLLWSGSNLFGALRRGLNAATGATRRRTFVQGRVLDISVAFLASLLLTASVGITALLTFLQQSEQLGGESPFAWLGWVLRAIGVLVPIAIATGILGTLYHLVPAQRLGWRPALAGGLFGAVGFEIGKNAFVLYTANFGSFDAVYGPIATGVILLVWLYYSSMIFLTGAAFGSSLASASRFRQRHPHPLRTPGEANQASGRVT